MRFLSPAISRLARMRYWQIHHWINDPVTLQHEVLQDLLTHGQYTTFGRKYNFNSIYNAEAFKEAIPIHDYNDIKVYIEASMAGEQNVLWNTPVSWFAKSSGTSGDKSKYIPITEESLNDCHFQGARDVLSMYYNYNPDSDLLTGKALVIGGSHQVSQLSEEAHCGDLSAVLLQNTPFYGQWVRTPDLSIALMDEWEEKIEKLADATIKENVTSISGVPTWTLVLIKRILEKTGKKTLKEVWPQFELYMHGGVSFTPYRDQFKKLIGGNVDYMEMYNASEGFFAAQAAPNEDGMLLFLNHGIYYEFMPMEEIGKEKPQTLSLEKVETNKNYALIISTNGGLWRYMIGDTIQFTSTFPFKIKVTGRVKHFINAFGEEVIVDNSDTAIATACNKTGTIVNDYMAAPVYFSDNGNGAHEWIVEFEKKPDDLHTFTVELDKALQSVNSDYEAKRYKDIALHMPVVHAANKGLFTKWLKSRGKLGGQHKVPRLNNDRINLEEVLSMM